jgi:hypothetical protein
MLWHPFRIHRQAKSAHRSARRRPLRPTVEALEDRWLLSTFTWVGGTTGDFNTAANWLNQNNANGVPGTFDTATIPANVTVTASQSDTVNGLTLNGTLDVQSGTFTVNGNGLTLASTGTLQVDGGGTAALGGGSLAGAVNVAANGTLNFSGGTTTLTSGVGLAGAGQYLVAGSFNPTVTLNTDLVAPAHFNLQSGTLNGTGSLTITGTFDWGTGGSGGATMSGTGTTVVASGATLNVGGSGNKALNTRTLINAGTINVTGAGNFDLTNGATLDNQTFATVNLQSDFSMGGGGTLLNDGTVVKTSPVGGTTTLNVTLTNTSQGTVHVQSGQLAVQHNGTNAGTFTADAGAAVTFPNVFSTYTLNGNSVLDGAGLFDVTAGTLTVAGSASVSNLQLDGGTVNGTGTLTPTAFTWNGGTLSAPTAVPPGGTLTVAGGGSKSLNGNLTNNGTVNVTSNTDIGISTTPTITNNGTFNLQSDVSLTGSALFTNAGTLTKSSPTTTGTTAFNPQLNNSGTVDVQSGTLQLTGGGAGTATSVWQAEGPGALDVHTGTLALAGGATFTGLGVEETDFFGTVQVNGAVTAQNFTIAGGGLTGSGTFTVTGTLDWTGGTINDPNGTISIPVGATLKVEGNSDKSITGGTMNLAGTTIWKDGGNFGFSNAIINNQVGATFTIQNAQNMGGAGGHLNNAGTLTREAVSGQTSISVFNTFTNSGTINVLGGTLFFATLTQTAGTTAVASGAKLQGTVQVNGGTLSGAGTVSGSLTNSGGAVLPGGPSSAGTLTLLGNYTQGPGGTLSINVGGTTPGPWV